MVSPRLGLWGDLLAGVEKGLPTRGWDAETSPRPKVNYVYHFFVWWPRVIQGLESGSKSVRVIVYVCQQGSKVQIKYGYECLWVETEATYPVYRDVLLMSGTVIMSSRKGMCLSAFDNDESRI